MNEKGLEVNDLIQIEVLGGRAPAPYASRVEGIGPEELVVAWPTERKQPAPIVPSQIVRVVFIRGQKAWAFEGVVRETRKAPLPVLVIRPSSPPRLLERRSDLRVRTPVAVTASEKVISLSGYKDSRELTAIESRTLTVSAGGFTIRHRTPLQIGTLFDVSMILPDRPDPLNVTARVVRCDPCSFKGPELYEIGFAYSHIPESARARLVRFVFRAQIEEMEAGE